MIRALRVAATSAVVLPAFVAGLPALYLATVSGAALVPRRRASTSGSPTTSFAIFVPAHDEEAVIAEALRSFDALDYPDRLVAVHVVADNCTDATADIVRVGGHTVHERTAPDDRGKGPALNWLFDRLTDDEFDAIVIVDADTSVDPDFLLAMDRARRSGVQVAQGFYTVRNVEPSPAASFRLAALVCRHRLRPLGRTRLGGSAGLYGNGMMFDRELLAGRRWSGHLIEDAEIQNELLLDGVLVAFVVDAVVRAEMPTTAAAAESQNERWERGRIELVRRFVPRLAAGLPRASGRRVAYADAIADHLVPPLSVLVSLQLLAGSVAAAGSLTGSRASRIALLTSAASLATVGAHAVTGLATAGVDRGHLRALAAAPAQIAWKTRLWVATLLGRRDVTWRRTTRNAAAGKGPA